MGYLKLCIFLVPLAQIPSQASQGEGQNGGGGGQGCIIPFKKLFATTTLRELTDGSYTEQDLP